MNPLISIGMPLYNCQHTLPFAIHSILSQTYENWELILIDDGSEDDTFDVAREFSDSRIRLIHSQENLGLPVQLNKAIALSRGDYFARMDGDDVSYPERLEKQLEYLEANPEIDLLGTGLIVFDGNGYALGKRVGPSVHADICARPWAGFPIAHPTYMGRIAWFRRFGYQNVRRSQDQDLLLRSFEDSQFGIMPQILLGYREGRLDPKKILKSRKSFGIVAFKFYLQQGKWPLAVWAVIERTIKAFVDIFAISTGLGYRVLAHRARPITAGERESWFDVWHTLEEQVRSLTKEQPPNRQL